MVAPRLSIDAIFAGDFKVKRVITEGEQRAIYEAEQVSTGKPVALKVLAEGLVADRDAFVAEVRVGGKIQTDHLVDVRAAGIDKASGLAFLAMELLEGHSLRQRLDRSSRGEPLPGWDEVLSQTLHGLAAVHKAGVVHGGIHGESVFLAASGTSGDPFRVELFGLGIPVVARDDQPGGTERTAYLAPEQVEGAPACPGSDVWAVALLAFEMLTHERYFTATDEAKLRAEITSGSYEPPSTRARARGARYFPTPLFDAWFAKCIRREPSARWTDAEAALEGAAEVFAEASGVATQDIEDLREPAPRSAVPPPLPPMVRRLAENPKPAILAIVVLVGVALGGGFLLGVLKPKSAVDSKAKAMIWARKAKDDAEKACSGGDSTACHGLGMMYQAGIKVPPDEKKAGEFFKKACDEHDASACASYASLLMAGEAATKNAAAAAELHRKACDGGYPLSCSDLADMFEQGNGVEKNPERAKDLRAKACKAGLADECR